MNKTKTSVSILGTVLAVMLVISSMLLSGCGGSESSSAETTAAATEAATTTAATDAAASDEYTTTATAIIDVKDFGTITVDLYKDAAPITVDNFIKLAESGFYDGLTFHRIIKDFMIQGGDPLGTGMGGSDETIVGEFSSNGYENNLKHERGVISMARAMDPDSASSQFFIMHKTTSSLDGQYAAFGMVTDGMDVVDKIAENTPVTDTNGTVEKENQPVINSIKIEYPSTQE